MNCPQCHKEEAITDGQYGVLPGKNCQKENEHDELSKTPEFWSPTKQDRIQRQRDKFKRDLLQPTDGEEFARAYPKEVDKYFTKKELKDF